MNINFLQDSKLLENQGFTVNLAGPQDVEDVLNLANDEAVRKNSFNQEQIKLENHIKWFASALNNKYCYFYIIRKNYDFVGSVKFDKIDEDEFLVGVQVAEAYRGKGLGSDVIKCLTAKLLNINSSYRIIAHIKEDNQASLKTFLKAQYKIIGDGVKNDAPYNILKFSQT